MLKDEQGKSSGLTSFPSYQTKVNQTDHFSRFPEYPEASLWHKILSFFACTKTGCEKSSAEHDHHQALIKPK